MRKILEQLLSHDLLSSNAAEHKGVHHLIESLLSHEADSENESHHVAHLLEILHSLKKHHHKTHHHGELIDLLLTHKIKKTLKHALHLVRIKHHVDHYLKNTEPHHKTHKLLEELLESGIASHYCQENQA